MKIENWILDKIAVVAIWATPAIPAYFGAYNAWEYLVKATGTIDKFAVVLIALVIETVGMVSAHTAMQFVNWNRTKLKSDDEAPVHLAIAAVALYVIIVILVNGLLDFFAQANRAALPYVALTVRALLSLLSLDAILVVAMRAAHNVRVARAAEAKADRRAARTEKRNVPERSGTDRPDFRLLSPAEIEMIRGMDTKQIEVAFGVSDRVARKWKAKVGD